MNEPLELPPCPFKGHRELRLAEARGRFWIECKACKCRGPEADTALEAKKLWQERGKVQLPYVGDVS